MSAISTPLNNPSRTGAAASSSVGINKAHLMQSYAAAAVRNNSHSTNREDVGIQLKVNGIVLKSIKGATLDDYLEEVTHFIDLDSIIDAGSMGPAKYAVFFNNEDALIKVIEQNAIVIKGQAIPVEPYIPNQKRIVLTGCPPFLPDEPIKQMLNASGLSVVGKIKKIKLQRVQDKFKHINSFNREVYVSQKVPDIPSYITVRHLGSFFNIKLEHGPRKCFKCGGLNHLVSKCNSIVPKTIQTIPTATSRKRNSLSLPGTDKVSSNGPVDEDLNSTGTLLRDPCETDDEELMNTDDKYEESDLLESESEVGSTPVPSSSTGMEIAQTSSTQSKESENFDVPDKKQKKRKPKRKLSPNQQKEKHKLQRTNSAGSTGSSKSISRVLTPQDIQKYNNWVQMIDVDSWYYKEIVGPCTNASLYQFLQYFINDISYKCTYTKAYETTFKDHVDTGGNPQVVDKDQLKTMVWNLRSEVTGNELRARLEAIYKSWPKEF